MTFLNNTLFALDNAPIESPIHNEKGVIGNEWVKWFNGLDLVNQNNQAKGAPAITLNSDFNFGAVPLTASGTFASRWDIEGTSFTLTPTLYGGDENPTGSKNYIKIETNSAQTLRIFQKQQDKKALATTQDIVFSMQYKSTLDKQIKIEFKLGYDNDNNGTVDEYVTSKEINLPVATAKSRVVEGSITTGKSDDSRPNQLYMEVTFDIPATELTLDLYYIKVEIGQRATFLYIDHPMEQLRITNTP